MSAGEEVCLWLQTLVCTSCSSSLFPKRIEPRSHWGELAIYQWLPLCLGPLLLHEHSPDVRGTWLQSATGYILRASTSSWPSSSVVALLPSFENALVNWNWIQWCHLSRWAKCANSSHGKLIPSVSQSKLVQMSIQMVKHSIATTLLLWQMLTSAWHLYLVALASSH